MSKKDSEIQRKTERATPQALLEMFDFIEQERDQEKELVRALRIGESSDRIAHFNPRNHLTDLHKKVHE